VKAYYDKKNKKNPGEITAQNQQPGRMEKSAAVLLQGPKVVVKPEEAAVVIGPKSKEDQPTD
jgi:hypothetical protein